MKDEECQSHLLQEYAKKDLLILGGGDGALLHELLKEEPKFVTMVDIDEAVMRACKEHLRSRHSEILVLSVLVL